MNKNTIYMRLCDCGSVIQTKNIQQLYCQKCSDEVRRAIEISFYENELFKRNVEFLIRQLVPKEDPEMNDYLKGFVDGYAKASEQSTKVSIAIDGRAIAEKIYKDVADLICSDNLRRKNF